MLNTQKEGMAKISTDKSVPYIFSNGTLTLHLGESVATLSEGDDFVLGQRSDMLTGGCKSITQAILEIISKFEKYQSKIAKWCK